MGILGPPYCGIGATIRIGREMLCLPYAGFFRECSPPIMYHMSCVTCHVSHVTLFFGQSGGANWLRVCYPDSTSTIEGFFISFFRLLFCSYSPQAFPTLSIISASLMIYFMNQLGLAAIWTFCPMMAS